MAYVAKGFSIPPLAWGCGVPRWGGRRPWLWAPRVGVLRPWCSRMLGRGSPLVGGHREPREEVAGER